MLKLTFVSVLAIAAISGQTLKEKVAAAQKRWEDQKKVESTWPDNVRRADVGVATTIIGPGASWPCSPSQAQIGDLMKMWKRAMDDNAPDSAMGRFEDAVIRTRSTMVAPMEGVKILAKAPGVRKIAVIKPINKRLPYQVATASGCWVAEETVVRPPLKEKR